MIWPRTTVLQSNMTSARINSSELGDFRISLLVEFVRISDDDEVLLSMEVDGAFIVEKMTVVARMISTLAFEVSAEITGGSGGCAITSAVVAVARVEVDDDR